MGISATIFVILILTYLVNASVLDPVIENVVHLKASKPPNSVPGIWKKKTIWKPRWVKEWKSAKVMKPVWRKVWSPVQIREWVPIPKPPPGWDTNSTPLIPIHPKPQKPIKHVKDSVGHGSYTFQSAKIPLWDPVPYPESQQPPPLPPRALHTVDINCGKGGCDNSPSQTFNHQQISEIIGGRYQTPDYYQNPEFSETVNHLTRLPPDRNNWRPPHPFPDFRFDNNFQGLPEFLIPPKIQLLSPQTTPNPIFEGVRPWIPIPPENKVKGHFITKEVDQSHKLPQAEVKAKNNADKENSQNDKVHPEGNRDVIQEAQLVGEYHYSTFDLPNIKLQSVVDEKEQQQPIIEASKSFKQQQTAEVHRPFKQQQTAEVHRPFKQQQTAVEPLAPFKQQQTTAETHRPFKPLPTAAEAHQLYKPEQTTKEAYKPFKPLKAAAEAHQTPKPQHNSNEERNAKPKTNQPIAENKHQQPEAPPTHVQKKHIPKPIPTNHFLQQEIILKEVSPQPNLKHEPEKQFLQNHSTTKLHPVQQDSNSTLNILQSVHPIFIPPNHRFSPSSESKNHNYTESSFKPEKNNTVQIVFATTPVDYNQSTEKSTTTEPYEIVFSSSLQATTESVTRSPVIIITPANP